MHLICRPHRHVHTHLAANILLQRRRGRAPHIDLTVEYRRNHKRTR